MRRGVDAAASMERAPGIVRRFEGRYPVATRPEAWTDAASRPASATER